MAQHAPSVTVTILKNVHCIETSGKQAPVFQDGQCFDEPGKWVLSFDDGQPF